MGKNQHVVPHNWKRGVRWANNERLTSIHDTQSDAYNAARQIAENQRSELLLHGRDWRIRERNSYWNDDHPPKG